jgi:hypothetical protein
MSSVIKVTAIDYPESDGKPMAETDDHRDEMYRHLELLRHHFGEQRVYVSGNLLIFFEQGHPNKFVVPDGLCGQGGRAQAAAQRQNLGRGKSIRVIGPDHFVRCG